MTFYHPTRRRAAMAQIYQGYRPMLFDPAVSDLGDDPAFADVRARLHTAV